MQIRDEILLEKVYCKKHALKVTAYACSSANNFKQLMQFFTDTDYRLAQRAAWSVCWAAIKKPSLVTPYLPLLVEQLKRKDVPIAVIRNSIRILQQVEIPEPLHGDVINICFDLISAVQTPAAIKAFSLTTLYNLSLVYPEIQQELTTIIEDRLDTETAAFQSRGKKILKAFDKK